MNANNSHDVDTTASVPEHTPSLGGEVSDYVVRNEGEKDVSEQTTGQFSDILQLPTVLNKTVYSETSSFESEQIPKKLLKKIKRKKNQSSRPIKKLLKGKTGKDDAEHGESSTHALQRENSDDEHPVSLHIQPISHGESVLSSSILDEVLSEKKRVIVLSLCI
jgi:hypothetical protein